MKKILLIPLFCTLLFGCTSAEKPDSTVVREIHPYAAYTKEKVNGHVYVIRAIGHSAGITHDPDCPCNQPKK